MRYYINFDKLINQFTPYYLGGRKLILYLQATASPLRALNDRFVDWANETRIAASMTSQILPFEWYLNRVFGKYFNDESDRIFIKNERRLGVPIYAENANVGSSQHMVLYKKEMVDGEEGKEEEAAVSDHVHLYYYNEKIDDSSYSFVVYSPAPNNNVISSEAYIAMLKVYINRYKLAGKTYMIKIV